MHARLNNKKVFLSQLRFNHTVTPAPVPKPVEVVTEEQKQEVENVTWELPDWCEDLEQNFNQIQVCGVALQEPANVQNPFRDGRKKTACKTSLWTSR